MSKSVGLWRVGAGLALAGLTTAAVVIGGTGGSAGASSSKSPIVVGGVWSVGPDLGADTGAEAAFDAFNASGGLNGQKIKFIGMQDDAQSETQDITATKALVADHVTAVVPITSGNWVAGNVLKQAGIPFFGWAITTGWWGYNNGFSFSGSIPPNASQAKTVQSVPALLCLAVKGGCKGKTVALLSINNTSAVNNVAQFAAEWKSVGAKVVTKLSSVPSPPAVVSDYTPYVQQLLTSNNGKQPDIIQQLLTPTDDISVVSLLKQSGFKGQDFNFSLYDPRAVSLAQGSLTVLEFAPWEQKDAAISTMIKRVDAVDPKALRGQMTEAGYWSGEEFIAAIKQVAKKGLPVTSANITKVLNEGWTFSIPGGTGPTTFPAAHTGGGGCPSVVSSNGKHYVVAVPETCVPFIPNPLKK